jgi:hypothetical protein
MVVRKPRCAGRYNGAENGRMRFITLEQIIRQTLKHEHSDLLKLLIGIEYQDNKFSATVISDNGELDTHEMGHNTETLGQMSAKLYGQGEQTQVERLILDNGKRIFIINKLYVD